MQPNPALEAFTKAEASSPFRDGTESHRCWLQFSHRNRPGKSLLSVG